jgi:hypothetical protein
VYAKLLTWLRESDGYFIPGGFEMGDYLIQQVAEQMLALPSYMQRQVLDYVLFLKQKRREGTPGGIGLRSAKENRISHEDSELIAKAIEEGCERIDLNEW